MSACCSKLPLAEAIRLIRQKRGFSQGQVARGVNISRSMITRYENQACAVSGERLGKIADFLQVDPGLFYRLTTDSHELEELVPLKKRQPATAL